MSRWNEGIGWPWLAAVALFVLLFTVYLLTTSGGFHIIDEVSLFAVTESAAKRGAFDTNGIAWTQWVNSPGEVLGAFGPEGDVFSKKGPALPLLAVPLYWLMWALPGVGLLQGTLLFNMVVTAATALLVWRTVLALGYGQRTGAAAALLYGLGTIAWPYATHFFGEPLSALALLGMFYAVVRWRQGEIAARRAQVAECRAQVTGREAQVAGHKAQGAGRRVRVAGRRAQGAGREAQGAGRRLRVAICFGLAAGLLVAGNVAHAVVLPLFLLYSWYASRNTHHITRKTYLAPYLLPLASSLLPLAGAAMLLVWYNWVRFGHPLQTGYHFEAGEGFNGPLWQGLWGLLFSPYRGLFWYTPLAIASLMGWPGFTARHKREGVLLAAVSGVLVLLFACWWMWWGGFAWGPRFLVPLTPFLVIVLAPMLERVVGHDAEASPAPTGVATRRGDVGATPAVAQDAALAVTQGAGASLSAGGIVHEHDDENDGPWPHQRLAINRQAKRAKPAEAGCPRTVQRPLPFQPGDSSPGNRSAGPPRRRRVFTKPAGRLWKQGLLALIFISVVVQLLAVTVNYVNYEIELRHIYPTDWADPLRYGPPALFNPRHSPVLGQVRLLFRDFWANEDLAWVQAGRVQWDVLVAGLALLALTSVALGLGFWRGRARGEGREARGGSASRFLRPASCILLILAALAFTGFALVRYAADPIYGRPGEGYAAILEEITAQAGPDDAIVTVAPYHYHIPMNRYRGRLPIYGYAQEELPLHAETERVLRRVLSEHERIWFVTAGLQPADERNGIERWLADQTFKADDRWFGDFRLLRYGTADELRPLLVRASFGSAIELVDAAIGPARAGSILAVELRWRALEPVRGDLAVFLQLLDGEGRLRAQRDGRPRGGYAPTPWRPGQLVVDRQGLLLPPELPPGEHSLILGWYDTASLERLPVRGREGGLLGDHLVLERIRVE